MRCALQVQKETKSLTNLSKFEIFTPQSGRGKKKIAARAGLQRVFRPLWGLNSPSAKLSFGDEWLRDFNGRLGSLRRVSRKPGSLLFGMGRQRLCTNPPCPKRISKRGFAVTRVSCAQDESHCYPLVGDSSISELSKPNWFYSRVILELAWRACH